jgi:O-antigen ligase
VLLTMVVPIVITFALHSPTRRWLYRLFLCVIVFAVFLSISRSAMVCGAVALLVLAASWDAGRRVRAFIALLVVGTVVYISVPGVLGTITRLFTGASDDPSIASRTGSYELAWQFITKSPTLGRGFGTFLPKYWILDNGYLGLLIEGGIVGLGGLLILLVAAAAAARQARKAAVDEFDRALAQALFASIAAGACALAFFDVFGFPQTAGCFFLLIGMAGAMRRLARGQASNDQSVLIESPADSQSVYAAEGALR